MMADQAALVNPGVGAATVENELSEKQRETSETNDGNLGDTVVKMKVDEKEKVKEGEKKKEQPAEFKAYLRLWTFGTRSDIFLQACGFLAALTAGAALPLMTVVFGNLVTGFADWGQVDENGNPKLTQERFRSLINKNALWFVYLFIGKFALVYIHTVCFNLSSYHIVSNLRVRYVKSILRQEIAYFDEISAGSVATKIATNINLIHIGMGEKIGIAVQGVGLLISAFAVAFSQQWKLTLVAVTIVPAILIIVGATVMLDSKVEKQILETLGKAGGIAEEALSTIRNVIAFGAKDKLVEKYEGYLDTVQKLGMKKGPYLAAQYSMQFSLTYCAYALTFWYGIQMILRREITASGKVVTVLFSVLMLTSSLVIISPTIGEITKASGAAKDLFETLDRKPEIDSMDDGKGEKPESITGRIEFQNIDFFYPARPTIKVLDNLSLICEENQTTALVGASGSGKSTIIALAQRWYDLAQGAVFFGGHNVKDLNIKHMRTKIGLVQQEPVLFQDTIFANIAFGLTGTPMEHFPEEEKRKLVIQACEEANCRQFIEALPEGFDTSVGERAGLMSGGQKQRIAIARSIVGNPPVLLLDEPTSALDPKSEAVVQAALDKASRSRTTIMVSHRLSTVKKADKIVVIDKGVVVETGTHKDLMAAEGAYYRLVIAQDLAARVNTNTKDTESGTTSIDYGEDALPDAEEAERLERTQTRGSTRSIKDPLKEEEPPTLPMWKCLWIITKENIQFWKWWVTAIIGGIGGGAVYPLQAFLFSRIVGVFSLTPGPKMKERGNFWALMYFVMAIFTCIAYGTIALCFTISAFLMGRGYRSQYVKALISQDVAYYDLADNSSGAMTSRLSSDPQHVHDLLQNNVGLIVIVITNMVSSIILAFAVGWKMALVCVFGALPPIFMAGVWRMKMEFSTLERSTKYFLEATRFATEAVGSIRTVSSLTLEENVINRYKAKLKGPTKKAYRGTMLMMILFGLSESLELLGYGLAFWYGGRLLSTGEYNAGQFFLVFTAVIFGGQSAGILFGFSGSATKAHSGANHIIHTRARTPPINSSTGAPFPPPPADPSTPFISLSSISFSYPTRPSVPVLQNFSLSVARGESLGICGASGCGKSTLISLLERFYDVTSGSILINGVPLLALDISTYRSKLALVAQEPTLYSGTIRDNILLGLPASSSVPEEIIVSAAKSANIHDFILSLPDGYSTDVGAKGLALSGGQRQRLAIARALIRDPELLLLDEATSALDTESEKVVQQAVEKASKGRTVVVVAHRLSTIRGCDRIVVVDAGRVVEVGRHEELVGRRGVYWGMCLGQGMEGGI